LSSLLANAHIPSRLTFRAVLLVFVVIAPLVMEPMKLLPQLWHGILGLLASIGIMSK